MKSLVNIILGIILLVILVIVIFFPLYIGLFPSEFGCKILGLGGISHVPANCIKYFITR